MLIFNGKKYAKNNDEFVSSLFDAGNTCNGYYKRIKSGVQLFNMQHELTAFLVANQHGERFIVSAHMTERGARYMYGTSSQCEHWLGTMGLPMQTEHDLINEAIRSIT